MVRIISTPNPFLRIWYVLTQIRRIWTWIRILVNRLSGEYGIANILRMRIIRYFFSGLSDKITLSGEPKYTIRPLIASTTYKQNIQSSYVHNHHIQSRGSRIQHTSSCPAPPVASLRQFGCPTRWTNMLAMVRPTEVSSLLESC